MNIMVLIAGIGGIAIVGILLFFVFIILLILLAIFKGNKRRGYRRRGGYIAGTGEQFVEVGRPDVPMGQETKAPCTKGIDHHTHPHHTPADHSMPSPTHHIDHTPPPPPMHHHG